MKLLPPESLHKTGPVDHADWNYKPVLGWIQRLRFKLATNLISAQRYERLLEIGYGSGVFMPQLATYCGELYGVDVHSRVPDVTESLARAGVDASLHTTGAEELPFDDGFFDCIVAVSSLEFVADLDRVCEEAGRVMSPEGRFIVITPGSSPLLDQGLKILTGKSAKDDFGDRRASIVPTLERWFRVASVRNVGLYRALDCRRKLQPAIPINEAPVRRPAEEPSTATIGDLTWTTQQDVEQAILAARRRRHNTKKSA